MEVGRLAMRVEGPWWVAYHARIGTMENAIELGRIRMTIAADNRDAILAFFQKMYVNSVRAATGIELQFLDEPRSAPENERMGNA